MIDFAYEDLETEATLEREENERYEAECAREDEQIELNAKAEHPYLSSLTPTPTKAQAQVVKERAEFIFKAMENGGASIYDLALCHLIIQLAEAVDEL